jgi:hypothetical protein
MDTGTFNMNWRRGLFRSWLVVSVLWISISWWAIEPISKIRIATRDEVVFHFGGQSFSFPSNTKREVIERVLNDYANGRAPWEKEHPAFRLSEVDKPIEQRVAEAIGTYQAYSRPDLIFRAWGPIILPPLALMLMGLIIGWVVRGFRRD